MLLASADAAGLVAQPSAGPQRAGGGGNAGRAAPRTTRTAVAKDGGRSTLQRDTKLPLPWLPAVPILTRNTISNLIHY
ncbi:hypothetical protein CBM2615_B200016 [Cupriavidus taiwanensis]|uniref:Uncharacterized protein n=1 Tax=Cupriavidus taiwanensis TaxID=164546 RepID=A0A375E903_9BURK|nr:hypothetical protein CBM2614_B210016 [Cupriavidus taiwanensis]SOZ68457.1 hypothetical protein CBM2615_B200016 [Cupriavidus taiwanensis]SOZ71541.1 hypothetical protein CBM2613_B180016 [Cupriavidus taiwanensis]SPA09331.1 hypothetical protein CBM2625_B180016 [Cupriavidus taiwanensis]